MAGVAALIEWRQRERERERQTEREGERETDRETDRDRQRESKRVNSHTSQQLVLADNHEHVIGMLVVSYNLFVIAPYIRHRVAANGRRLLAKHLGTEINASLFSRRPPKWIK